MAKKRPKSNGIRRDLKPGDWIEIKYKGKTFLVAISSLLDAYLEIKRSDRG